jgi:hypothetical protein
MAVSIDPRVLELGDALSKGYTSIASRDKLTKHAQSTRYERKKLRRTQRALTERIKEERWS